MAMSELHSRRATWVAASQASLALLLLFGVWVALPARYLPVDLIGTAAALALLVSAAGLGLGRPWGGRLARLVAWGSLGIGCLTVTALFWSAATLAGLYGPVGSGGALLMTVVALLVIPYLVGLPALQLSWLASLTASNARTASTGGDVDGS